MSNLILSIIIILNTAVIDIQDINNYIECLPPGPMERDTWMPEYIYEEYEEPILLAYDYDNNLI